MTVVVLVNKASKRYGATHALRNIDFTVRAGEIVGLVGPNGAGKTTLLRLCAGLLRPSQGKVDVRVDRSAVRYFAGERSLPPNVTVRRWRRLWLDERTPGVPRLTIGQLSRGSRQRLGLETMPAACGPGLVLLDEPWEGLDPDAGRWLSAELVRARAAGDAILVSSHRIHDLATVCDRCEFLVLGVVSPCAVRWTGRVPHEVRVGQLLEAFDRARGTVC
jgi:ABC-type multidrug transport system ATPase subunit